MSERNLYRSKAGRRLPHQPIGAAARRVVASAIPAGARTYDRARDLPALIRLDPFAKLPETAEEIDAVLMRLERALRAERNRARSGHWTYDLNRHIALRQAYMAERDRLAELRRRGRSAAAAPDRCP